MGDFNRGGSRGGGGGFRGGNDRGGRPSFQKRSFGGNDRGGDRERAEMHKATCSECSKICEVPFRPSNEKPVYCNDCFSSKREGVDRKPRSDFGDRAPRREFNDRPQRPEIARPQPANDEMKNQLRDLNSKMDRLVTLMEKMTNSSAPKVVAQVVAKPAEVKKVVATSKPVAKVVAKKVVAKASKIVAKKVVTKKKK